MSSTVPTAIYISLCSGQHRSTYCEVQSREWQASSTGICRIRDHTMTELGIAEEKADDVQRPVKFEKVSAVVISNRCVYTSKIEIFQTSITASV